MYTPRKEESQAHQPEVVPGDNQQPAVENIQATQVAGLLAQVNELFQQYAVENIDKNDADAQEIARAVAEAVAQLKDELQEHATAATGFAAENASTDFDTQLHIMKDIAATISGRVKEVVASFKSVNELMQSYLVEKASKQPAAASPEVAGAVAEAVASLEQELREHAQRAKRFAVEGEQDSYQEELDLMKASKTTILERMSELFNERATVNDTGDTLNPEQE